ncbi:tetraspanin-16 isoform X2 [Homo sapiens]|uniref:tetraspanin-16 isoform X2 n=1 Tax=Homo sapiens TaxID=9606 RepID=UPI0005D011AD|nr:tetraspanin-16 isoform X2 [Homo sapiens]XP_054176475.1 tetraspanin-16 isoform X2 [Homo sapiens]|eukprot:XP_011526204.1 tetraspanin-16 isoform X2 [Homo sapiens]
MAEIHTPYSSLKKLLSLLNGFVAVSGIILVGLGIGGKCGGASLTNVLGLSSAYLLHVGNLCLVMGCITVLLGCAGWYGATKESRGTLLFCILSMVIVLIMEVTAATVVLLFFPILKCCGVNNYTDFSGSSFEMTTGHTYPRSCCKSIGSVSCDGRDVSPNVIHQKGCFHKLLKITKTQSFTLSGSSLGAAVIQLPGILATLLLFIKLG